MKRIITLITILLIMSLVGCKSKDSNVSYEGNDNTIEDTREFTTGLKLSNNDAYDGERRVFSFDKLLKSYDDLAVYWEGEETFVNNIEGNNIIKLLFKNISNGDISFSINDYSVYSNTHVYNDDDVVLFHPNGAPRYYLAPNETKEVEVDISPYVEHRDSDVKEIVNISLSIIILDANYNNRKVELSFKETFIQLSTNTFMSDEYNNATIDGVIYKEDGSVFSNARIEVITPFNDITKTIYTDETGHYSIVVPAAKSSYSNAWKETALLIENIGYEQRCIPIYAKNNQTVTADVTLYRQKENYKYEEVKTVDLGLQSYEYDSAKDIITFVPFHTGYDPKEVSDLIYATTTDFDGNVLNTYKLPQEIPYVDMSEDGKYSVIIEDYLDGGFTVFVIDNKGDVYYQSPDLNPANDKYAPDKTNIDSAMSRCAQLSNDNKYLVIGDGEGDVWLVDIQTDKVLYSKWTMGQVRNIKFSSDDKNFYISNGGGQLFAFDLNGNIIWQTDITTWATEMEVTSKYIVVTLKCAGDNLRVIDRNTGELVWSYSTMQPSKSLSISSDEKYLWYGAHSSSTYSTIGDSIFDLNSGELIYMLRNNNNRAGYFSKDGSKILTMDMMNVYVYDAHSGALLYKDNYSEGDDTGNFTALFNDDGTKFVFTSGRNDKKGNYGVAHYYRLVEIEQLDNQQHQEGSNVNSEVDNKPNINVVNNEVNSENESSYSYIVLFRAYYEYSLQLDNKQNILVVMPEDDKTVDFLNSFDLQGKSLKEGINLLLQKTVENGNLQDTGFISLSLREVNKNEVDNIGGLFNGIEDDIRSYIKKYNSKIELEIEDDNYGVNYGNESGTPHQEGVCPTCNGSGIIPAMDIKEECKICNGTGVKKVTPGNGGSAYEDICDVCFGKGYGIHHDNERVCNNCNGTGKDR